MAETLCVLMFQLNRRASDPRRVPERRRARRRPTTRRRLFYTHKVSGKLTERFHPIIPESEREERLAGRARRGRTVRWSLVNVHAS